jgi:DNA-binding transcriptional ArsR family regulator
MRALNPTLWRTCRVLSGQTRLRLLRRILDQPGQAVSQLAAEVQIGISDASQELRRLQSRGLLQVDRQGPFVFYRLAPDPQVSSAAPLLKALKASLADSSPAQEEAIIRIATALSHARRIAIAKELLRGPQTTTGLEIHLRIRRNALNRHLRILVDSGFLRRNGKQLVLEPATHPLAQALVRLLRN